MIDRRQALIGLGCVALGARGALAEGAVLGRIVATVDGIVTEWFMTRIDGESQSRWSGVDTFQNVRILGHTAPDTARDLREALVLSFDVVGVGGQQGFPVARPEIRILERGFSSGFMARGQDGARIALDERRIEGGTMVVAGRFRGRLGYSDGFGAQLSFRTTRYVEGRFEGQVDRAVQG